MAALPLFINAAAALIAISALIVLALRIAAAKFSRPADYLADLIDDVLPQTQCGQCGHAGCRPYAEAIAQGEAINRCPPGGASTIAALAELLNKPALPLDLGRLDGELKPKAVAFIREAECIGCTKCIQACPVDAILGATKAMHTVIAAECTGCDLCVEPCPVDCIEMRPLPDSQQIITHTQAMHYKTRFVAHNSRLQREESEREARRIARQTSIKTAIKTKAIEPVAAAAAAMAATNTAPAAVASTAATNVAANKQEQIQAAIARAKAKKAAVKTPGPQR